MRYTKKPVTISAICFSGISTAGVNPRPIFNVADENLPDWLIEALEKPEGEVGEIRIGARSSEPEIEGLFIGTLEGAHFARPGDFIIRGVQGELYPCKPDIFAAIYSPADQAEAVGKNPAYRGPGMDFGQAVDALKEGLRVARAGWNGKGMFLFLVPGSTFTVNRPPLLGIYPEGTVIDYQPHIDMKTAQGTVVPWLASQGDVLAKDWEIVDEAPLPWQHTE